MTNPFMNNANPFMQMSPFAAVKEGDTVTVEWDVDPAYVTEGNSTRSFTGVIRTIDDWIYAQSKNNCWLRCPIKSLRLRQHLPQTTNPFMT